MNSVQLSWKNWTQNKELDTLAHITVKVLEMTNGTSAMSGSKLEHGANEHVEVNRMQE